jgi:uncharacterized damage-inducible protein DinB
MTIAESLLAEFVAEASTTRKFLQRIPDDQLSWRPHEKSMTAGQLALHIAIVPSQVLQLALPDEATAPDFSRGNPQPASTAEILAALDQSIGQVKAVLPTLTDQQMQSIWRMKQGDRGLLAMPRAAFLRSVMLNHWYHHRGQLGVYLRLLGAKVPSSYGPSGDELPDFIG